MIRQLATGVELLVRVIPRSSKSAVAGVRDGRFLVRLAAPPVEGAANAALIALLSDTFGVPRRSIHITAGDRSRSKVVLVEGITAAEAARVLEG